MKVHGWVTDQTDEYCVYRVQLDGIDGWMAREWIAGDFEDEGWVRTGSGHDADGHYILMFSKRFINLSDVEWEDIFNRYEIEDEDSPTLRLSESL